MKKLVYLLSALTMVVAMAACSKDDDMPDDDVIWDIAPSILMIQLEDESGANLLDPEVSGNWVGEPMWIGYDDKSFDVIWNKDDLSTSSRALMPHFYGAVWSGVWPNRKYYLYFGEFSGESSRTMNLTFGITAINTVYEFEFSHRLVWENKEPHFDDHITYNGNQIEGYTLTLVLPKRQN